jgi:serine/threonine protein kinase
MGNSYCELSDIYSFGIVIYEIYSRILPFTNVSSILTTTEKILTPDLQTGKNILINQEIEW